MSEGPSTEERHAQGGPTDMDAPGDAQAHRAPAEHAQDEHAPLPSVPDARAPEEDARASSSDTTRPAPPRARAQLEDRQRGKRMLGLLNSTLTQSREPRKRLRPDARAAPAPDARASEPAPVPPADLAAERAAHDAERASIRRDMERVHALAEEIAAYETAYRTARSQKRRLSSYLVTHVAAPSEPRVPPTRAEAAATMLGRERSVPIALRSARAYDVYYLPRKLLPEQEDARDAQEEAIDDALDRADDEYDRVRAELERELYDAKARLRAHGTDPRAAHGRRAWS